MKSTFIILISFMALSAGCSTTKNTTIEKDMQIKSATFHDWREAPTDDSELPEVGTKLVVTLQDWPQDYAPAHIIFRKRKSLAAEITDSTEESVVIRAQIIRSSAVMTERSETTDLSDRLVFTDSGGDTSFVEISEWEQAE